MGTNLIITRSVDRNHNKTGLEIEQEAWLAFIEAHPLLRLRTEALEAENPATGEENHLPVGPAQSEIELSPGKYGPFLSLNSGELTCPYSEDFNKPTSRARRTVVQVAEEFAALIMTDANDNFLEWSADALEPPHTLGVVMVLLGLALIAAGVDFAMRGGGFSYVISGVGVGLTGVFLYSGRAVAIPVYAIAYLSMWVGSFVDSGSLEPARVGLPTLIGAYLLSKNIRDRLK